MFGFMKPYNNMLELFKKIVYSLGVLPNNTQ